MINLKSGLDGFNVILGSWAVHVASFITLLSVVRPPTYEDDPDKTTHGKVIYSAFLILHFCCALVKYSSLYLTRYFDAKMCFFVLWTIIMSIYVCQHWVFTQDRNTPTKLNK